MNKMFRPMEMSKSATIKMRRLGMSENYNFSRRAKWYPAGWGFNKHVLAGIHGRMHYFACHAPESVRKQWDAKYQVFMNRHFGDAGRASVRYLNTWSCHSWL